MAPQKRTAAHVGLARSSPRSRTGMVSPRPLISRYRRTSISITTFRFLLRIRSSVIRICSGSQGSLTSRTMNALPLALCITGGCSLAIKFTQAHGGRRTIVERLPPTSWATYSLSVTRALTEMKAFFMSVAKTTLARFRRRSSHITVSTLLP